MDTLEVKRSSETVADFNVRIYADGQIAVDVKGSLIEIAMMVAIGMRDVERLYPEARHVFQMELRKYMEE